MQPWVARTAEEGMETVTMDRLVAGLIGLGVTLFLVVGLCVWVWTWLLGCA
jgi:hypothetical protein